MSKCGEKCKCVVVVKGPRGRTGETGATGATGPNVVLPKWAADPIEELTQLAPTSTITNYYSAERIDNFNAYNPVTGVFTAPVSGVYTIYAQVFVSFNGQVGQRASAVISLRNVTDSTIYNQTIFGEPVMVQSFEYGRTLVVSTKIFLAAGEQVTTFIANIGETSITLLSSASEFYGSMEL